MKSIYLIGDSIRFAGQNMDFLVVVTASWSADIENDINSNSFKFSSDKNIIIEIVYKTLEEENMQDL